MKITRTRAHESINKSFLMIIEEKAPFLSRMEPFLFSEFIVFLHKLYCDKNETKIKQNNIQYLCNTENKIHTKLILILLNNAFTYKNHYLNNTPL